jgi:hypothetical protein
MYLFVHGTFIVANATTNASNPTVPRIAPAVFSKPVSHPDWSCQPAGFSSLLMSKKRLVPGRSLLVCSNDQESISERTGISLPVEVIIRVAMALELESQILASRTMCEWDMVVGNIVEEVNLVLLQ